MLIIFKIQYIYSDTFHEMKQFKYLILISYVTRIIYQDILNYIIIQNNIKKSKKQNYVLFFLL